MDLCLRDLIDNGEFLERKTELAQEGERLNQLLASSDNGSNLWMERVYRKKLSSTCYTPLIQSVQDLKGWAPCPSKVITFL